MKKIFLDVGGHRGQTLEVILSSDYHFDIVHCFEPIPELYEYIINTFSAEIAKQKLFVHNFGLTDRTGKQKLYGTESHSNYSSGIGASLYADKIDIDSRQFTECQFLSASDFIRKNIDKDDFVVMKLNCEGGEAPILKTLLDNKQIHQISFIMIDFDIVKIPSMKEMKNVILDRFKEAGFSNYIIYRDIGRFVSAADAIKIWLSCAPNAEQVMSLTWWEKVRVRLLLIMPIKMRLWTMRRRRKMYKFFGLMPESG